LKGEPSLLNENDCDIHILVDFVYNLHRKSFGGDGMTLAPYDMSSDQKDSYQHQNG